MTSTHEQNVIDFMVTEGLDQCKKRKRKLLSMSPEAFLAFKLNALIAKCCKVMDIEGAYKAYISHKQLHIYPSNGIYISLLNLFAGFGDQGSGSGTYRDNNPPSNVTYACIVFQDIKNKQITLNESVYTAMIRCLCESNRESEALCIYHEMVTLNLIPKLRTFYPLLYRFSILKNEQICYQLYHDMTITYTLIPSEREYNCMLLLNILLQNDSHFYSILFSMQEDIFIPSYYTWVLLYQWFTLPHNLNKYDIQCSIIYNNGIVDINQDTLQSMDIHESTRCALLQQIELLATSDEAKVSQRSLLDINPIPSIDTTTTTTTTTTNDNNNGKNDGNDGESYVDETMDNRGDTSSIDIVADTDTINTKKIKISHEDTTTTTIEKNVINHISTDNNNNNNNNNTNTTDNNRGKNDCGDSNTTTTNVRIRYPNKASGPRHRAISSEKRKEYFTTFKNWLHSIQSNKNNYKQKENNQIVVNTSTSSSGSSNSSSSSSSSLINGVIHNNGNNSETSDVLINGIYYDVIIDGANIGYYKQNYPGAPTHVDYLQIHWILLYLQAQGYHPLIVLHTRHMNTTSMHLSAEILDIIDSWKKYQVLYITPAGCNDDWYWLYMTVFLQCKIVSNDEMRDHHFQMLSPRWFSQWKERNQIHFTFGNWCPLPYTLQPYNHSKEDKNNSRNTEDASSHHNNISSNSTTTNNNNNNNNNTSTMKDITDDTIMNETSTISNIINSNNTSSKKSKKVMWRQPILKMPLLYSHRMQCINLPTNTVNTTISQVTMTTNNTSSINNIDNNSANSSDNYNDSSVNSSTSLPSHLIQGSRFYFPPPLPIDTTPLLAKKNVILPPIASTDNTNTMKKEELCTDNIVNHNNDSIVYDSTTGEQATNGNSSGNSNSSSGSISHNVITSNISISESSILSNETIVKLLFDNKYYSQNTDKNGKDNDNDNKIIHEDIRNKLWLCVYPRQV